MINSIEQIYNIKNNIALCYNRTEQWINVQDYDTKRVPVNLQYNCKLNSIITLHA